MDTRSHRAIKEDSRIAGTIILTGVGVFTTVISIILATKHNWVGAASVAWVALAATGLNAIWGRFHLYWRD